MAMKTLAGARTRLASAMLAGLCIVSAGAYAASDEIQVYSSDLRMPGESGVDVHVNYAASGVRLREWDRQIPANHALNLTPEFSWHLADKMDWGLYLPTTRSAEGTWFGNGAKARVKYIDKRGSDNDNVFAGVNFEMAYNRPTVSESQWSSEVRLILGRETENWMFVTNALLGNDWAGPSRSATPGLALNGTVLRKLRGPLENYSVGVEHHAELGQVNDIQRWSNTPEMTYAVGNYAGRGWALHLGAGHNWTSVGDKLVYKAIVSLDF